MSSINLSNVVQSCFGDKGIVVINSIVYVMVAQ